MSKHIFQLKGGKTPNPVTVCINVSQPIPSKKSLGPRCFLKKNNKTVLQHQLDLIDLTFKDYKVVLITGFEAKKIFNNRPKGVVLVENQLYEDTRGCEHIRLVSQAVETDNIIFIPDNIIMSPEDLKLLSLNSTVLTSKYMLTEKVVINEGGKLMDFIYYKNDYSNFYSGCFSLSGKELKLANSYSFNNSYSAYLDTEILTQVVRKGGNILVKDSSSVEFLI